MEKNIDEQIDVNRSLTGYFEELALPSPFEKEDERLEDNRNLISSVKKLAQSTLDQYI